MWLWWIEIVFLCFRTQYCIITLWHANIHTLLYSGIMHVYFMHVPYYRYMFSSFILIEHYFQCKIYILATLHHEQQKRQHTCVPTSLEKIRIRWSINERIPIRRTRGHEECETELWLNDDGSVTLGATNGPQYSNYQGTWDKTNDDDLPFRMRLTQSYEVPVGDISYDVIREFWGSLEMVGASVSVSGGRYMGVRMQLVMLLLMNNHLWRVKLVTLQ